MKRTVNDSQAYAKLITAASDMEAAGEECYGVMAGTALKTAGAFTRRLASALYADRLHMSPGPAAANTANHRD